MYTKPSLFIKKWHLRWIISLNTLSVEHHLFKIMKSHAVGTKNECCVAFLLSVNINRGLFRLCNLIGSRIVAQSLSAARQRRMSQPDSCICWRPWWMSQSDSFICGEWANQIRVFAKRPWWMSQPVSCICGPWANQLRVFAKGHGDRLFQKTRLWNDQHTRSSLSL